jgi:outer membrane receptor for ferrienterochelin and colicins
VRPRAQTQNLCRRFSQLLFKVVAGCVLFLTFPAWAEQPRKDLLDMTLEELLNVEVYSASKHLQKAGEAPSSVTVITADDIRTYGYRTLADILRSVRSFYVTYDRNYSYLGVRGLGRPGDYNTRVLLLIDGHRMNNNIYDQAMIGSEFPLDIDVVDRVEIIRGPISSLYGQDAVFGVINVITRKGGELNGLEVSSAAASFATYQGRVTYGGRYQKFEILASTTFLGSDGHTRLYYPEFNTRQSNFGYALRSDDDQVGSALVTLRYQDFTFQSLYGNRDKAIPTASFDTLFNVPGTRTVDTHAYFDLSYRHTFVGKWAVLARTSYDRYIYKGTYEYLNSSNGLDPNLDFGDGEWWGTELQVSRDLPFNNRVTAGGEYRYNLRQNQIDYSNAPFHVYLNDRRHSEAAAFFLQDEWALTRKLTLNAGLRFDYYNGVDSSTNPRAAVIYRARANTALKFVYGTAFRVPNMFELYYGVLGITPALKLAPERIRSFEFVWEQGIAERFALSTSIYHNDIEDLISQEILPNGNAIFANLDRGHASGAELEFTGTLPSEVEGKVSYGVQQTINRATGNELSNSPHHLVKLNLNTPVFTHSLIAGLDAQYTSARSTLLRSKVAGFPVFNFTLLGRNLGKHAELSASVYNLLDRKYFDPGAAEHQQTAIQQDGRSFRLNLSWTWSRQK